MVEDPAFTFSLGDSGFGPGWRGAVSILSPVPTFDWVLLGCCSESNKAQDFGSLYLLHVCKCIVPILAGNARDSYLSFPADLI